MTKTLTTAMLAMLLPLAASAALSEESTEELEARCQAYAQEDGVPQEELEAYIAECVAGLRTPEEPQPEAE